MKFSVSFLILTGLMAWAICSPTAGMAQCSSLIAAGSCTGGNGAASNNININAGQTYWYTGSGTFGAGVNMNGGTLRICGTLTMNNINFNSGTILIEAGGSLTLNASFNMNGSSTIQNRGTLTINGSITMQNANNKIVNATTSSLLNMNAAAYQLQVNSSTSKFINNGTANINTLFVQGSASAGAVCLGPGSCTNTSFVLNNFTNGFDAPNGPASLHVTVGVLLNNNLASNNDVLVCKGAGVIVAGGAGWGGAQVFNNCNSCASVLPIDLVSFQVRTWSDYVMLNWRTSMERNNKVFHIERSSDQQQWTEIGTVAGSGSTSLINDYSWTDTRPLDGVSFYRLRQEDYDGRFSYSPIQQVRFDKVPMGFKLYPNPAHDQIQVDYGGTATRLELLDIYGRRLKEIPITPGSLVINLADLPSGTYMVRAGSDIRKFIRN
jgi:hypothetical protein